MEKEIGNIKFTEIEDGFRVEVKGKTLKEAFSCCGVPMMGAFGKGMTVCCTTDEECCPPEKEKK